MKALGIEFILSGRTVEFTPNEFLAPIKKAVSETARLKLMVRTNFYNEPDTLKNSFLEQWYTRRDSNPRPSVPKTDALIH